MLIQVFKNQTIRLKTAFADVGGTDKDPEADVTFTVTDPDGTVTTYTFSDSQVTRDSAGHYSVAVTPDKAGKWKVTALGDGTNDDAVDADEFYVLNT